LTRAGAAHLGILGFINLADYREYLPPAAWREDLKGCGGTPVNLLCRELLARGRRLTVFTLNPAAHQEVILDGDNLRICIGPYGGPPGRAPARDFFARERSWLATAIARERPDLLHAHWTYQYALAAQASHRPHVITAHDAPLKVLRHDRTPYRLAHTMMAYRVLSRARNVVSVSPYVASHLRRYMLYRGPTIVVPNGMPQALFDHTPPRRGPGDTVIFATVLSVWSPLKNGQAALAAFSRVRQRRPADRLLMIGEGLAPGGPAEAWARRRGLGEGVLFLGPLPHERVLACLAREVDVLVHPSQEESFGMTLIEASALGLAVIGGRRSGAVPWVLEDGAAGSLVDVRSPDALASAMLQLAEDRNGRSELGQRARENALRRFHIRKVADAYEEVYTRILRDDR